MKLRKGFIAALLAGAALIAKNPTNPDNWITAIAAIAAATSASAKKNERREEDQLAEAERKMFTRKYRGTTE